MVLKEILAQPEHEEHAIGFLKEMQQVVAEYEARYALDDFSVVITNSADDFVEQMNMQIDELDEDDPDRESLMSEITLADESTTIETGVTINLFSLSSLSIDHFTTQADRIARQFSGTTDHFSIAESNDEIPRYEKQLFYTFAG